jgi:lysozyme
MDNLEQAKEICIRRLLVPFEGTGPMTSDGKFIAYVDPATGAEPITISWGMTFHADGTKVKLGEIWDYGYAVKTKAIVLNKFLNALIGLSPSLLKANSNQIAALLSFIYNVGIGNYKISTLRKKINKGEYYEASLEFAKWNKANGKVMNGLTKRRKAEANLLLESV